MLLDAEQTKYARHHCLLLNGSDNGSSHLRDIVMKMEKVLLPLMKLVICLWSFSHDYEPLTKHHKGAGGLQFVQKLLKQKERPYAMKERYPQLAQMQLDSYGKHEWTLFSKVA